MLVWTAVDFSARRRREVRRGGVAAFHVNFQGGRVTRFECSSSPPKSTAPPTFGGTRPTSAARAQTPRDWLRPRRATIKAIGRNILSD